MATTAILLRQGVLSSVDKILSLTRVIMGLLYNQVEVIPLLWAPFLHIPFLEQCVPLHPPVYEDCCSIDTAAQKYAAFSLCNFDS